MLEQETIKDSIIHHIHPISLQWILPYFQSLRASFTVIHSFTDGSYF